MRSRNNSASIRAYFRTYKPKAWDFDFESGGPFEPCAYPAPWCDPNGCEECKESVKKDKMRKAFMALAE